MSRNENDEKDNNRRKSGVLTIPIPKIFRACAAPAESPPKTHLQTDFLRSGKPKVGVVNPEVKVANTETSFPPRICRVDGGVMSYNSLLYETKGPKRGEVLIINNIKFAKGEIRKGAEKDEKDLNNLMLDIGFDIKAYRNLSKSGMMEKINKFKSRPSLTEADISVVVIMSHGTNRKNPDSPRDVVGGGYTNIIGTDLKGLEYDEVLNEFTATSCPFMAGKPKIFIFQCCRGDQREAPHTDAMMPPMMTPAPIRQVIKEHGDMLIAFSTLPGLFSYRDSRKGSWFIQSICKVFRENAHCRDIEDMFKLVDQDLSSISDEFVQTSSYECRGFNRSCYLNPVKHLCSASRMASTMANGQEMKVEQDNVNGDDFDERQDNEACEEDEDENNKIFITIEHHSYQDENIDQSKQTTIKYEFEN